MSVAKINLWIPDYQDTCRIDNTNHFVATVQNCEGQVLEWSGGRYWTKDNQWHPIVGDLAGAKPGVPGYYDGVPGTGDPGHVCFEVPPGCYIVSASTHIWIELPAEHELIILGNLGTQHAMVKACCGEDVCVTVYQPTGWHCSVIEVMELLLPVMAERNLVDRRLVDDARRALQPIVDRLKPSNFDLNSLEVTRTIRKRLTSQPPKDAPRDRQP